MDIKILTATVGAEARADSGGFATKVKAGMNLVETEAMGVKTNLGINADTGVSAGRDGVEAKVVGLGFKVGKEVGISTPFGGISFKLFD
jgi:hypothetical protein